MRAVPQRKKGYVSVIWLSNVTQQYLPDTPKMRLYKVLQRLHSLVLTPWLMSEQRYYYAFCAARTQTWVENHSREMHTWWKRQLWNRCTILQCVTVMCCSGTTQQHVPRCSRSSYRWDAFCHHPHGAAAHVHSPQPQQQSPWVPHTATMILTSSIIT